MKGLPNARNISFQCCFAVAFILYLLKSKFLCFTSPRTQHHTGADPEGRVEGAATPFWEVENAGNAL